MKSPELTLEREGPWSPSPISPCWSFSKSSSGGHLSAHSFEDSGHRGVGDDSVVTFSGEDFSSCKTTSPKWVRLNRVEPSVVGAKGAGPEVA